VSQITHLADVFVFDTAETLRRQNLPASSLRRRALPLGTVTTRTSSTRAGRCSTLTRTFPAGRPDIVVTTLFGQMPFLHKQSSVFSGHLNDGEWSCRFHDVMSNLRRPRLIQKASTPSAGDRRSLFSAENPPRGSPEATRQSRYNANCAAVR